MRKSYSFSIIVTIMLMMPLFCIFSCGSDDDEISNTIPAGKYIEENGHESELFSLEVSGNHIIWTCTIYGEVDTVVDYTYTINDNQITLVSKKGTHTLYFNRNGRKITIGDITYIKQ